MTYELEKSLTVQKALVADLELKNRSLREIADASEKKRAGYMERLTVAESTHKHRTQTRERLSNKKLAEAQSKLVKATQVYNMRLQKLTDELDTSVLRCITAEEESQRLTLKVTSLEESLSNDSKETKKQIDRQKNTITSLTEENQKLKADLREGVAEHSRILTKVESKQKHVISELVDENQKLKAKTREATAEYSRLQTRMERLKDRGHVIMKLERVLDSFD